MILHDALSPLFPEERKPHKEAAQGDGALLAGAVRKALEAAEDFDNDSGLEALGALGAYEFGEQVDLLIAGAVSAFEEYDYDGAVENLNKLAG